MKRILYVAHLQSHIRNFHIPYLKHLKDRGFYVAVATRVDNMNELLFLDKVYDVPFARSPFTFDTVKNYKILKNLFEEGKFDIIHCHTPVAGIITRLANRFSKSKSKVYYTAHGFHFFKGAPLVNWLIYYPAELICSKFTDVLFTMNQEDYQRAKAKFNHPKVEYIHGAGIDLNAYNVDKNDTDIIQFVNVGEMIKRKNQITIIQALERLENVKWHLTIAGDGILRNELEDYVNEHNLNDKVTFLGHIKPVVKAFDQKDIFLFASYHEGLPVAVMEAMACGLPCIVSKVRGNTDLIDSNGGMIIENTVDAFTKAILEMIDQKNRWVTMGQYNQKKVQQYSQEIVFAELDKYYVD